MPFFGKRKHIMEQTEIDKLYCEFKEGMSGSYGMSPPRPTPRPRPSKSGSTVHQISTEDLLKNFDIISTKVMITELIVLSFKFNKSSPNKVSVLTKNKKGNSFEFDIPLQDVPKILDLKISKVFGKIIKTNDHGKVIMVDRVEY